MSSATMDYLKVFGRVSNQLNPSLAEQGLHAYAGSWLDSAAIKVLKPQWSEGAPATAQSPASIFFSVWVTDKSLKADKVLYNIHALSLRKLSGYSLQSREFAAAFRIRFAKSRTSWPNVSVEFGPQTLMEGWIVLKPEQLQEDIAGLIRGFAPLASTIDELLAERVRA